jgi:LmbE family N-acetylglucosaminyl deacetylase
MESSLKLMAVFAHPDDESMGMGAALAKYAAEGISTHLVCATRGEKGWFGPGETYPGPQALGQTRTAELLAAARELGLQSVDFLNAIDGELDQADSAETTARLVSLLRDVRPQVVVTFGPDGDYGHPDHIAICQLTAGALVCAADPAYPANGTPHRVAKFYFMVNSPQLAELLLAQFGDAISIEVNGVRRSTVAWPDWAITTRLDLKPHWQAARRAILCHRSQLPSLGDVEHLPDEAWQTITSATNAFFRQYSLVALPPGPETDFFSGLR